jgi:hypothetical protein
MSTESANTIRGHEIEKLLIARYPGASLSSSNSHDVEYLGNHIEVKSSLSWHGKKREGGRFSIEAHAHDKDLKKLVNDGERVLYSFFVVPRSDDDVIETDKSMYPEVWMTWESVDRNIKHKKLTDKPYYYRISIKKIFG